MQKLLHGLQRLAEAVSDVEAGGVEKKIYSNTELAAVPDALRALKDPILLVANSSDPTRQMSVAAATNARRRCERPHHGRPAGVRRFRGPV